MTRALADLLDTDPITLKEARRDLAQALYALEQSEKYVSAAEARAASLERALQMIHDTFTRDMEQGYRTRDKQFAVEIARAALGDAG